MINTIDVLAAGKRVFGQYTQPISLAFAVVCVVLLVLNPFQLIWSHPAASIRFVQKTIARTIDQATAEQEIENVLSALNGVQSFGIDGKVTGRATFGKPISPIVPGPPGTDINYTQLFQYTSPDGTYTNPYTNSVEKINNADSTSCFYVAYTDPKSPYWYDEWNTVEQDQGRYGIVGKGSPFRVWAHDTRPLSDMLSATPDGYATNWNPYPPGTHGGDPATDRGPWEHLKAPFTNAFGPAFPSGRGPAPHWFKVCLDQHGLPTINSTQNADLLPTSQVRNDLSCATSAGTWPVGCWRLYSDPCLSTSSLGCEWAPFEELVCTPTNTNNCFQYCSSDRIQSGECLPTFLYDGLECCMGWPPEVATGVITQGWRSGQDWSKTHPSPYDNGGDYYRGNFQPENEITERACGSITAAPWCNDWENGLWPDPPARKLVGNFSTTNDCNPPPIGTEVCGHSYFSANVWSEMEQWQIPLGYRPDPGDRATLVGRLIQDLGHEDDHYELHPLEAAESAFLQTGPLQRYEPYVPISAAGVNFITYDNAFPSLVVYNGKLYMAWEAEDSSIHFSSYDGNSWTAERQATISPPTNTGVGFGPSLAAYNGKLYMAWKDQNEGIHISSYDGNSWTAEQQVPGIGTDTGPALATYNGKLYMAWKGITFDSQIHFSTYDSSAPQQLVDQLAAHQTASAAGVSFVTNAFPSIAVFNSKLYMAWEADDTSIHFSSYDGNSWTAEQPATFGGVGFGPSLAPYNGKLYMAWIDQFALHPGIHISSYDGNSWTAEQQVPGNGVDYESRHGPSLAMFNDKLYMAWQGGFICPQFPNPNPCVVSDPFIYYSTYDGDHWQVGMGNLPTISDYWIDYTHGRNATVTKLVVTQDWQGEPLNFDVWPPSIPDACSTLHSATEGIHGSAVDINVVRYPNHVHVTVTPSQRLNPLRFSYFNPDAVSPGGPSRELVYSFMLWWEHTVSQPGSQPYLYCSQFGSLGTGNGQFNDNNGRLTSPHGIALDSHGNIYVTDPGNFRVEKFDSNGNFLKEWGGFGNGDGNFTVPWAIATDSSDNVYVTDTGQNQRVEKFTSDGKFITKWGGFGSDHQPGKFDDPEAIAIDRTGQFVYVADFYKRVQKFDSNGAFILQWGKGPLPGQAAADGEFYSVPQGLAVDANGYVYVADTYDYRIQKFDGNGMFVTKWGGDPGTADGQPGIADGQFGSHSGGPRDVAVDGRGYVFVVDAGNNRTQKFSSDGTFIGKWGSHGTAAGQLSEPRGVAIDQSGNVYVADSGNYRIQIFVPSFP